MGFCGGRPSLSGELGVGTLSFVRS